MPPNVARAEDGGAAFVFPDQQILPRPDRDAVRSLPAGSDRSITFNLAASNAGIVPNGVSRETGLGAGQTGNFRRIHSVKIDREMMNGTGGAAEAADDGGTVARIGRSRDRDAPPGVVVAGRDAGRRATGTAQSGQRGAVSAPEGGASSLAPLAAPPLHALGDAPLAWRSPAAPPAASPAARPTHPLSDLAISVALLAVVAATGIVAANAAIDHPTIVEAALGCVVAIWPVWVAMAVVFGVAAWRKEPTP